MKRIKKPGKIAQAILDEVVPDSREPDSDEDETRAKIVGDEVKILHIDCSQGPQKCLRVHNNWFLKAALDN